jgi:transcriptional regulator with XRE-family HTH domain
MSFKGFFIIKIKEMVSMENPIKEIRENLGLKRAEFADILGASYSSLSQIENNLAGKPYKCVLEGLEELGFKKAEVLDKWDKYKEHKRKEKLNKIKDKLAG